MKKHEDVVAHPYCCGSNNIEENIGSRDHFLLPPADSLDIFQLLSEFDKVRDVSQLFHDQGVDSKEGAYVNESKGKQPLEQGKSGPLNKCMHDSACIKKRACELKRRKRISAKLKTLQDLIPHSDKNDQASILDGAINYINSLKLQLDMMSPRIQVGPMSNGYGPAQFPMGPSGFPLMVGPTSMGSGGLGFQLQPIMAMQPQVAVAMTTPGVVLCPSPPSLSPTAATTFSSPFHHVPPQQLAPGLGPGEEQPCYQPVLPQ